jgi:hypothetical protein
MLKDVRNSGIQVRKVTLPTVEIQPASGLPVRLTVASLSNSALEIEEWIKTARSRLFANPA